MAGRGIRVVLTAALALWAVLALAACGGAGGGDTATTSRGGARELQTVTVGDVGLVAAYCLYRSDTKAQALACEARADPDAIRARGDDAGRWARGELQTCGKGAGELCEKLGQALLESPIGREAP